MARALRIVLLTVLLAACLAGQEKPDEIGFFQEDQAGPSVEKFILALDGGSWTMNCYVAWDAESRHAVVIDPGTPSQKIKAFIQSEQLIVQAILLTHGHGDHVGGVVDLAAVFPAAPIYLHRDDQKAAARVTGSATVFRDYPDNGQLSTGKMQFQVIPTPGHSPGSVCLRSGDILFSGDTLFAGTIGKACGDNPAQREANFRREVKNIQDRLLTHPTQTRVFPGHGPSTTIGREKSFNRFLTNGEASS
ncbi:MAG: MBL fold metallo-hydrolase [Candidatus Aminicenantes bacterium]|nr:MBL fold metallo-hydrolase [Candidatus Aminicenantes bacterium]